MWAPVVPDISHQCTPPGATPSPNSRSAAFIDRDGTLITDANYLSRPDQLRLIPGVSEAIRALNDAAVPVIVITNQSGIARGYFTAEEYCEVERALEQMLGDVGALVDRTYHCPHLPEISGPCECRKPGLALFQLAAREHGLQLDRSLYVGDRWRDVSPALELGGTGVLVPASSTPPDELGLASARSMVAPSIGAAVENFLRELR